MLISVAACSSNEDSSDPTATPSGNVSAATPTTKPTEAPTEEATPTPEPTEEPTPDPDATPTPEPIDAFILDFWHENSTVYEDYFMDTAGVGDQNAYWEWTENEGFVVTIEGNDPFIGLDFFGDSFNLEEYPIFKIRIKNPTPSTTMEFFLPPSLGAVGAGDFFQAQITASSDEFVEYTFDLAKIKGASYVAREVTCMRMDILSLDAVISQIPDDGWTVAIDYIGFFPNMELAETYSAH